MGRPAPVARMTYAQYLAAEVVCGQLRRADDDPDAIVISQSEPLVEVYRRTEGGRFEFFEARAGQTIELASIGAVLDVSAVYANPLESR
jgi:hypothetical protein